MGIIAGKRAFMDAFIHPEKGKRVLIAGTFNAHPLPTAAAIATLRKLASPQHNVYEHVRKLGKLLEEGLRSIFKQLGVSSHVAREGSAFCAYFMDHAPRDYHDIAEHHNFAFDKKYRFELIKRGIFNFPLPIKQGSISFAHSVQDIEETLVKTEAVIGMIRGKAMDRLPLRKKLTPTILQGR
jgi:glutamate-1-semialdehyde 2,1-aminomutase